MARHEGAGLGATPRFVRIRRCRDRRSMAWPLRSTPLRPDGVRVQTRVRLLGSPVSGWSLAGEAWPRPYRRPNAEPIAQGRGMGVCAVESRESELNRTHPVRGPAGASRCARACKTAPAVLWQPRISTAQTPMPRPPASNRGCPDPVSQVMNQHRRWTILSSSDYIAT